MGERAVPGRPARLYLGTDVNRHAEAQVQLRPEPQPTCSARGLPGCTEVRAQHTAWAHRERRQRGFLQTSGTRPQESRSFKWDKCRGGGARP